MEHNTFDSTLLICLYSNVPTLSLFYFFLNPRLAPSRLLRQIASPSVVLSLAASFFLCCSHLLIPSVLAFLALSLNKLGLSQSIPPDPNSSLDTPHIPGLAHHVQHRLMLIWFNPDRPLLISLHTHTDKIKLNYFEAALHT